MLLVELHLDDVLKVLKSNTFALIKSVTFQLSYISDLAEFVAQHRIQNFLCSRYIYTYLGSAVPN